MTLLHCTYHTMVNSGEMWVIGRLNSQETDDFCLSIIHQRHPGEWVRDMQITPCR